MGNTGIGIMPIIGITMAKPKAKDKMLVFTIRLPESVLATANKQARGYQSARMEAQDLLIRLWSPKKKKAS
jgi:hypothetical protein